MVSLVSRLRAHQADHPDTLLAFSVTDVGANIVTGVDHIPARCSSPA